MLISFESSWQSNEAYRPHGIGEIAQLVTIVVLLATVHQKIFHVAGCVGGLIVQAELQLFDLVHPHCKNKKNVIISCTILKRNETYCGSFSGDFR